MIDGLKHQDIVDLWKALDDLEAQGVDLLACTPAEQVAIEVACGIVDLELLKARLR